MNALEPVSGSSAVPGRGILIALSIAAPVLLSTTVLFGTMLLTAIGARAEAVAPPTASDTPPSTPDPKAEPATVHRIPITVGETPLDFGTWVAEPWEDGEVSLFVPVTNDSATQAVTIFYDLTAYDADGRILDRAIAIADLLPESAQIMRVGTVRADPDAVASLVLEQTDIAAKASPFTGSVTISGIEATDPQLGEITATIASTLSPTPERADFQAAAFVDGEMIGVCDTSAELAAGGNAESCHLRPVSSGILHGEDLIFQSIPEDAELRAFLHVDFELD
ncbi:hypothetical protein QF046_001995 [Microbacterium sp. W4I4]|uniref:hypothetical protein n=1 Tax=Microbacterium sp. W4I4 TaxID=3042295 RepID=UPI002787C6C4|nr:hypothetical protein [Microbacterium sp. W4I4]MDQ0614354.1 hypothetical protein [Microbacterium sp. W4I4]